MLRSTLALAVVLSVASLSRAADLFSSPVYVGSNSCGTCKVVNVTSAVLPAHVQVIETGGTVLADSGTMSLFPSQIYGIDACYTADYVYCRFVNANTRKIKADLTLFNAFSGDFSDTTVVPAQ
jgi:hypothetical protein